MINRIINSYLDNLKSKGISYDSNFARTELDRIDSILNLVNLPDRVIGGLYIDNNNLPKNTKHLYDTFEDCCYSIDSALVCVEKYNICPYIISMLVEKLYKRCFIYSFLVSIFKASYNITAPWDPFAKVLVIFALLSCPAISHIWTR